MSTPTLLADVKHDRVPRAFLLATLVVAFMAAMTAKASATIEVQNYNDPAGDPTTFTYQLSAASDPMRVLASDVLGDGGKTSFGPDPSTYGPTYTVHAVLPPGWQTVGIQCENKPGHATFTYDLANSSVALTPHGAGDDHYCAFTNRRISSPATTTGGGGTGLTVGGGSSSGAGSGVSPTLPRGRSSSRKSPALLRIRRGTHYAKVTIRTTRRSVIKAQLRKGKRVVGTKRVEHSKRGTYVLKVKLAKKWSRHYHRRGHKHVTFTLRVVVVGSNKATKVFSSGVIVRI